MPKFSEKYIWTAHSRYKMSHYRLTESRIKRIIRHPARIEEGILDKGIAAMQPADGQKYSEIWTMYIIVRDTTSSGRLSLAPAGKLTSGMRPRSSRFARHHARSVSLGLQKPNPSPGGFKIKIITAWRYPGKSPERDPVPAEVVREVKKIIF